MATTVSDAHPTRFSRLRARTRDALLDAAVELFQTRGVRATTIEAICARADVSQRTFFNHFKTREHLYSAIAQRRLIGIIAYLDELTADPRPFQTRFAEFLTAVALNIARHPAYRELLGEMLTLRVDGPAATSRHRSLSTATARFITAGIESGQVSGAHPPQILADIVIGALTAAITNWCDDPAYDLTNELAQIAEVLQRMFA
jgi:AcrR family transcriptional regulator